MRRAVPSHPTARKEGCMRRAVSPVSPRVGRMYAQSSVSSLLDGGRDVCAEQCLLLPEDGRDVCAEQCLLFLTDGGMYAQSSVSSFS